MFGIGPEELMLVALLALLVLGPERLPRVMRDMGRVVGDLRRTSDELRSEFLNADKYLEPSVAAPATVASAEAAPAPSTPGGPADEPAFDREMREARERLRET
ncbi:MAG: twin-arginine translocase TatA/TatE family subunit [Chloroflexota bacterium]|nr:twin-arginine translocase TatA/TatE family subunit [Chloroflexota bacterium]